MNSYTFSCSTPDDWTDWHFLLKTFAPVGVALASALIASLAFSVAKTQKTIASNKYNMDLFDKRWSVFEEFYILYKEIIVKHNPEFIHNKELYSVIISKKSAILKASKVFENIHFNEIENIFYLIDRLLGLKQKFIDARMNIVEYRDCKKTIKSSLNAMKITKQKIRQKYDSAKKLNEGEVDYVLRNYYDYMKKSRIIIINRKEFLGNLYIGYRKNRHDIYEVTKEITKSVNKVYREMDKQLTISQKPTEN